MLFSVDVYEIGENVKDGLAIKTNTYTVSKSLNCYQLSGT